MVVHAPESEGTPDLLSKRELLGTWLVSNHTSYCTSVMMVYDLQSSLGKTRIGLYFYRESKSRIKIASSIHTS